MLDKQRHPPSLGFVLGLCPLGPTLYLALTQTLGTERIPTFWWLLVAILCVAVVSMLSLMFWFPIFILPAWGLASLLSKFDGGDWDEINYGESLCELMTVMMMTASFVSLAGIMIRNFVTTVS